MKKNCSVIQNDIMRYKKNKLASSLALLGLAFGCLYFLVLYAQTKNDNYYYTWKIAADVIYNLFFLLLVFLFSEQVKNYQRNLFVLQLVVGAIQLVRIFWLPLSGLKDGAISTVTFVLLLVYLLASGLLIIASAIIGYVRSKAVDDLKKKIESGEIDIDAEIKADAEAAENAGGEANA